MNTGVAPTRSAILGRMEVTGTRDRLPEAATKSLNENDRRPAARHEDVRR